MNLIKVLISYVICLIICVSLFWACVPTIHQGKVKIEYDGNYVDKITNIGIDNYEISFNTNESNKIHSFGYFRNDTIANGLIALFYENGNLNTLYHKVEGVKSGSDIFSDKTGEVLSLNNFKDNKKNGFQYEKLNDKSCIISFYENGIPIKQDTIIVN